MLKKMLMCALGGILLPCLSAHAEGELMVMPASTRLFNAHEQMIKVRNVGDSTLYLAVMLQKVTNPGMAQENKINMHDLPSPGVLATPEKLTLGPNQSRDIRLTSLVEPTEESLYRLYITPVKSLQVSGAPVNKITAPMSVSIGYGVLVRHMPAPGKQHSSWTHRCAGGNITLVNTGNVRVLMTDVKTSPTAKGYNIGLFPGTPQTIKGSNLTLKVEDKPTTVSCP